MRCHTLHLRLCKSCHQIARPKHADANVLDIKNLNRTPLHPASEKGHVGVARVLVERGVDTKLRTPEVPPMRLHYIWQLIPGAPLLLKFHCCSPVRLDVHAQDDESDSKSV
jgi:hypothetical protein